MDFSGNTIDSSNNIIDNSFNGNLYIQFYEWSGDTSLVKMFKSANNTDGPVHRLYVQISQDDTMNTVLNAIGLLIVNITDIHYPPTGLIYAQVGTNSILRTNQTTGSIYDDSANDENLNTTLSLFGLMGDASIEIYATNLR